MGKGNDGVGNAIGWHVIASAEALNCRMSNRFALYRYPGTGHAVCIAKRGRKKCPNPSRDQKLELAEHLDTAASISYLRVAIWCG